VIKSTGIPVGAKNNWNKEEEKIPTGRGGHPKEGTGLTCDVFWLLFKMGGRESAAQAVLKKHRGEGSKIHSPISPGTPRGGGRGKVWEKVVEGTEHGRIATKRKTGT